MFHKKITLLKEWSYLLLTKLMIFIEMLLYSTIYFYYITYTHLYTHTVYNIFD